MLANAGTTTPRTPVTVSLSESYLARASATMATRPPMTTTTDANCQDPTLGTIVASPALTPGAWSTVAVPSAMTDSSPRTGRDCSPRTTTGASSRLLAQARAALGVAAEGLQQP